MHPQLSHLASPGHQLLLTRFGPLDLLWTIGSGLSYRDLIADTVAVRLDDMEVRMLTLESLIAAKRATGRDKNKAVLALLDQTLREKQRK